MEDFETKEPKYKYIHGARVPNVEFTAPLGFGHEYYIPDPASQNLHILVIYRVTLEDRHAADHNLMYPHTPEGKDAAIAHAQAMLGIHPDQLI